MRIRKFNEGLEDFDMEFIHECFIDFEDSEFELTFKSDDFLFKKSSLSDDTNFSIKVKLEFPDSIVNRDGSIQNFLDVLESKEDLYENLRVCLVKVGSRYDTFNYYIYESDFSLEITIHSYNKSLTHKISSLM